MIRKKIAIVIQTLEEGGAEKVASILSYEFAKKHDVTLILFETKPWMYPHAGKLINLKIPDIEGSMIRKIANEFKRVVKLRKIFKREKFSKIISFLETANMVTALSTNKAVVSVHTNPNVFSKNIWKEVKWIYPKAKKVIAVSEAAASTLRKKAKLKNVITINNPFDFKTIRETAKGKIAIQDNFIIAVGRLVNLKRFDLLISAYAKSLLIKTYKLIILGEGELRQKLQHQINHLGLKENILLLGQKNNPYKYIAKAKFLVLSSEIEGFPLVLVEALGLGKPVVATDCKTGPNEIIRKDINGILVEEGNEDALIQAMDKLHLDHALYDKFAKNAKESVAHLEVKSIANLWLNC